MPGAPDQSASGQDDLGYCAGLVRDADPDRFRAAMAAPVAARTVLLPLYAFNVEVARAPWVTQEPLIARMRLQWWHDALAEISSGAAVRRHGVTTPLARALSPDLAEELDQVVLARHWDIEKTRFDTLESLLAHLEQGPATLLRVGALALGAADSEPLRLYARAAAIAGWLRAVPELRARNCPAAPLPEETTLQELARLGLGALRRSRSGRAAIAAPARAALLPGWETGAILQRSLQDPEATGAGRLRPGPARSAALLAWQAATGRY